MNHTPPKMRTSSYFINQSPSDDEHFPYWTPEDYLLRKFELGNAGIRQLLAARTSLPYYTRKPSDHNLMKAVERFNRDEDAICRSSRYVRTSPSELLRQYAVLGRRQWMEVSIELHRTLSPSQCEQRYIELLEAAREFLKGTVVYLKHEPDQTFTLPSKRTKSASTAPVLSLVDYSGIDSTSLAVSGVQGVKSMRFISGTMLEVMTRKVRRRMPTGLSPEHLHAKAKSTVAPALAEVRQKLIPKPKGRAANTEDYESYGSDHSSDLSSDDSFFYTSSEGENCGAFPSRRRGKPAVESAGPQQSAMEVGLPTVDGVGEKAAGVESELPPADVPEDICPEATAVPLRGISSSSQAMEVEVEVVDLTAQDHQEECVDLCDSSEDSELADDEEEGASSDDASVSSSGSCDSDSSSDSASSESASDFSLRSASSSSRSARSERSHPAAKRQRVCPSQAGTPCIDNGSSCSPAADAPDAGVMDVEDVRDAGMEEKEEKAEGGSGRSAFFAMEEDSHRASPSGLVEATPLNTDREEHQREETSGTNIAAVDDSPDSQGVISDRTASPAASPTSAVPPAAPAVSENAQGASVPLQLAQDAGGLTSDELALLLDLLPEGAYRKSEIGWHAVARRIGRSAQCVYTAAKRLRAEYRGRLLERKLKHRPSNDGGGGVMRKRCYVQRPTDSYDPRSIRVPKSRYLPSTSTRGRKRKNAGSPELGSLGHTLLQGAAPSASSLANIFKRAVKEGSKAHTVASVADKDKAEKAPSDVRFQILPRHLSPAQRAVPSPESCVTVDERLRRALMLLFGYDLILAGNFKHLMKLKPDHRQILKNEKWYAIAIHLMAPVSACWERLCVLGKRRGFAVETGTDGGVKAAAPAGEVVSTLPAVGGSAKPVQEAAGADDSRPPPLPRSAETAEVGEAVSTAKAALDAVQAPADSTKSQEVDAATAGAEVASAAQTTVPAGKSAATTESEQKEAWWSLTPTLIPVASSAAEQTCGQLEVSLNYRQRVASFGRLFEASAFRESIIEAFLWLECTELMTTRQTAMDEDKLQRVAWHAIQQNRTYRPHLSKDSYSMWLAVGQEMDAFSFDCHRVHEAIVREREREARQKLLLEKLELQERQRQQREEMHHKAVVPTLTLTRDQLLKRALSFLFSCPIVNESSCTRVRDQEAPGKGGFPADVRWTAIALYLRTSVAACWQRFLKLAEARHRAARWGLQPNDKQASLPVHSETAESSAGGEFPAPPADAATEEKWWTSAPENRVRLDPKEPEPQIPDVLYSPTPTDSAAAARPPLPLHAITLELLHLLHTGVRAPPTLLDRQSLRACVEKTFGISASVPSECQKVLNINSTYQGWLAIALALGSRSYTCIREFAIMCSQMSALGEEATLGPITAQIFSGMMWVQPHSFAVAATAPVPAQKPQSALSTISSQPWSKVTASRPMQPEPVSEPNSSAAILFAEQIATQRRTQGKELLIFLLNAFATRYQVMHGSRITDALPPWRDAYLDELLVRAVWMQFDQGGQSSQRGGSAVDGLARWVNVSALVNRGTSDCMLRYVQLSIAQSLASEGGKVGAAAPFPSSNLPLAEASAGTASDAVLMEFARIMGIPGQQEMGSSSSTSGGQERRIQPLALTELANPYEAANSNSAAVMLTPLPVVPNLETPLPPFVVVALGDSPLAVRGLDFELLRCCKLLLPKNYQASTELRRDRTDVWTVFTAVALHLSQSIYWCIQRHCDLRNWRLCSLQAIFDGECAFQPSGLISWRGDKAADAYLITESTLECLKNIRGDKTPDVTEQFQQKLSSSMVSHDLGDLNFTKSTRFRLTYARLARVATEMHCAAIDCVRQYAAIRSRMQAKFAMQLAAARSLQPPPVQAPKTIASAAPIPFVPRPLAPAPLIQPRSILSVSALQTGAAEAPQSSLRPGMMVVETAAGAAPKSSVPSLPPPAPVPAPASAGSISAERADVTEALLPMDDLVALPQAQEQEPTGSAPLPSEAASSSAGHNL